MKYDEWQTRSVPEWLAEKEVEPRDLVRYLIAEAGITLLTAPRKKGTKSFISDSIGIAVATGTVCGGWIEPTYGPTTVLKIEEEGTAAENKMRLRALCRGYDVDPEGLHRYHVSHRAGVKLDAGEWGTFLYRRVQELEAKLVIVDSRTFCQAGEENDNDATKAFMAPLAALQGLGVASLVLSHTKKTQVEGSRDIDEDYRGAGALADYYDRHIGIRQTDAQYKARPYVKPGVLRSRNGAEVAFKIRWEFETAPSGLTTSARATMVEWGDAPKASAPQLALASALLVGPRYTLKTLMEAWKMDKKDATKAITELVQVGLINIDGAGWKRAP